MVGAEVLKLLCAVMQEGNETTNATLISNATNATTTTTPAWLPQLDIGRFLPFADVGMFIKAVSKVYYFMSITEILGAMALYTIICAAIIYLSARGVFKYRRVTFGRAFLAALMAPIFATSVHLILPQGVLPTLLVFAILFPLWLYACHLALGTRYVSQAFGVMVVSVALFVLLSMLIGFGIAITFFPQVLVR